MWYRQKEKHLQKKKERKALSYSLDNLIFKTKIIKKDIGQVLYLYIHIYVYIYICTHTHKLAKRLSDLFSATMDYQGSL